MPLQITHLGKFYYPDSGGIEGVTRTLAEGAIKAGYRVRVVCFDKSSHRDTIESINGVEVLRAGAWITIKSQPLCWTYLWHAIFLARNSDIVHIHMPNMLAAFVSLFIPSNKIIVHWHSDVIGKGMLGSLLKILECITLDRAKRIIATTKTYADYSNALNCRLNKVSIIPLGCEDFSRRNFSSIGSSLPEDVVYFLRDKKLILSVGRLVPYKGFELLIESAKYLDKSIVIAIVGSGPLRSKLQDKIDGLGLNGSVRLLGRQGEMQLHELYKVATLFCLPSIERSEAFGLVLAEAMCYGLPIVAANILGSGVPWVNQHGVTGINVEVGEPKSIANACSQIIFSEKEAKKYSHASRLRYENEFTEDLEIQRALSLYEEFI